VTPDVEFTLHSAARGQAVDLGAIRRTDAIVDLLAGRRLLRPHALGDPAITLLRGLAADVDAPDTVGADSPARPARRASRPVWRASRPVWRASGPARRAGGRATPGPRRLLRPAGQGRRGSGWAPSAAAAAVITSVAAAVVAVAAAGLVVMGALTRLGGVSRHHAYHRVPRRAGRLRL
jgi:hypothetical protein